MDCGLGQQVVYLNTTNLVVFLGFSLLNGHWSLQLSVLSKLNVGESGILVGLDLPESVQNHLMHMGFVPDALVTVLRRAPAGDPTVYGVDGMEIALRHETAEAIRVRAVDTEGANAPKAPDAEVPRLIEVAR